jgi:hypothetical protein
MNDIQIYNKNKLIPSLLSSIFSHAVPGPNWSAISSQNMQNLLDIFVCVVGNQTVGTLSRFPLSFSK